MDLSITVLTIEHGLCIPPGPSGGSGGLPPGPSGSIISGPGKMGCTPPGPSGCMGLQPFGPQPPGPRGSTGGIPPGPSGSIGFMPPGPRGSGGCQSGLSTITDHIYLNKSVH